MYTLLARAQVQAIDARWCYILLCCWCPQDAAISLVLSEAVYKQLDEGGADRATVSVSELLQQYPTHLGLRLMGIRWENSKVGYRCACSPILYMIPSKLQLWGKWAGDKLYGTWRKPGGFGVLKHAIGLPARLVA